MATAAATAPHPTPPTPLQQQQHQQDKDQKQQKALSMNAIRLKAIGDRLKAHLRGMNVPPIAEFAHLVYAFARCASGLHTALLRFRAS
jgi:E3 SUMO-protein ligase PIAS1